ncbi:Phosphopantothenoylcysteine decarboxylase [Smittium culicis]|uniref:Phosphopantothenoylcysteine decarboxylase n=1 Tax=Smittium culicis TaxID=133412 RepID=A0A1R1YDW5_9FUNG|nr:Phosphopantothenoylcysteine decarboxylase [Smittium culicis]
MDPASKSVNILLGLTGSVATIKLNDLVTDLNHAFSKKGLRISIRVVATKAALFFLDTIPKSTEYELYTDADEWSAWHKKGDPVIHIELRKWADIMLIAPLDANTLAKLAAGLCDNLLTSTLRAWDFSNPVLVCPAMNTFMYTHKLTALHLLTISDLLGYHIIEPSSKLLACGDTGIGAMAPTPDIANKAASFF